MKLVHRVRLTLLLAAIAATMTVAAAQQAAIPPNVLAAKLDDVVPVDPQITIGTLPNGFRYYIRRHQMVTEVWYKAYPGLTNADLWRHSMLREGYERRAMGDQEARAWLALI